MDNNRPKFGLIAHTNIALSENDIKKEYGALFDIEAKNIFKFSTSLRSIIQHNASNPLQPNTTYTISLYVTLRTLPIKNIVTFLNRKQSLYTGVYGLVITYKHAHNILPPSNTNNIKPAAYQIMSFDSIKNQANGSFRIPYLHSYANDVHGFLVAKAEDGIESCIPPGTYFISVTPLSKPTSFSAST